MMMTALLRLGAPSTEFLERHHHLWCPLVLPIEATGEISECCPVETFRGLAGLAQVITGPELCPFGSAKDTSNRFGRRGHLRRLEQGFPETRGATSSPAGGTSRWAQPHGDSALHEHASLTPLTSVLAGTFCAHRANCHPYSAISSTTLRAAWSESALSILARVWKFAGSCRWKECPCTCQVDSSC